MCLDLLEKNIQELTDVFGVSKLIRKNIERLDNLSYTLENICEDVNNKPTSELEDLLAEAEYALASLKFIFNNGVIVSNILNHKFKILEEDMKKKLT